MDTPKALREAIGLGPGPVEVAVEGTRIILALPADNSFVDREGIAVIPSMGGTLTDEQVRDLVENGRR